MRCGEASVAGRRGKATEEVIPPWVDFNDKNNRSVPTKPTISIVVGKAKPEETKAPAASPPRAPPPNELRDTTRKPQDAPVSQALEEEVLQEEDPEELLDDKDPHSGKVVVLSSDSSSGSSSSGSSDSSDSESSSSEGSVIDYEPPKKKKKAPQKPGSTHLFSKKMFKFCENLEIADGRKIPWFLQAPDNSEKKYRKGHWNNPICLVGELTPRKSINHKNSLKPGVQHT